MKRPTRTVYDPPFSFERIRELIAALDDSEAELSKEAKSEIAITLSSISMTFGGYRRGRGRPASRTRRDATLAILVAKRFGVDDTRG
jgi:hypothetical protein